MTTLPKLSRLVRARRPVALGPARPGSFALRRRRLVPVLAAALAASLGLGIAPVPAALEIGSAVAMAGSTGEAAQADRGDGNRGNGRGRDSAADRGTGRRDGWDDDPGWGDSDMDDGGWDGSPSDGYVSIDDDLSGDDAAVGMTQDDVADDPGAFNAGAADPGRGAEVKSTSADRPAPDAPGSDLPQQGPRAGNDGATSKSAPRRTVPMGAGRDKAGQPKASLVLVELFTSQGCTACPPAESLLGELVRQPGILALALHVDYWDYLGWKDNFAQPRFTSRQRSYARRDGARSVFTPQLVIGGVAGVSAPRPAQVAREIARQAGKQVVQARVAANGGRQRVTLTMARPLDGVADIVVIRAIPQAEVDIRGGENIGRTLRHVNVVRDWDVIAAWDGAAPLVLDIATAGAQRRGDLLAVIVQERLPGPGGSGLPGAVLGAIRLR